MVALNFVDLFCGAGGWTTGLKKAGLRHVLGIDSDKDALASYRANHGDHALLARVEDVNMAILRPYLARLPGSGSVDVLFASPPCQSLSMAGSRKPGDPADTLFLHAIRIARALKAPMFVMENVVGLLSKPDRATGEPMIESVVAALKRSKYVHVEWRVLNSSDYEVPQVRKRVVIIASTRPLVGCFPSPVPGFDGRLGKLLQPPASVAAAYWLPPKKRAYYRERAERTGYVRFVDVNAVAKTMRAGYHKSRGAEALVVHGQRMRLLTELECARIQSFPDSYEFAGARGSRYRQIGNAVPPMLAYHVGRAIKKSAQSV
jgi:DNA (cytosine-5)-methyltransferase 1